MLIKCFLIINFNQPSVAGNIWGLFFLMTVSHPADVDTSCSCCVWSFFSLLKINLKRDRERNDDKRDVERERGAPDADSLSAQLHPAPCALKVAAEGLTQHTIWAWSSRGGTSFTLQSLPVYTTPCSTRTHTHFIMLVRFLRWPHKNQMFCFMFHFSFSFKTNLDLFIFPTCWSWIDFPCCVSNCFAVLVASQSVYSELDFLHWLDHWLNENW